MQLLLATTNPHKLDELRAVIATPAIQWTTLDVLAREYHDRFTDAVEDGETFEANALKKAEHYAQQSGWITVADDSGLEVDALGGEPGVYSARYAGTSGPRAQVDQANNRKLLEALHDVPIERRTARFVCCIAIASPASTKHPQLQTPLIVRGTVEGRILLPHEADNPHEPALGRGHNGFGYDPLFMLPDTHPQHPGKTTAELASHEKNAISHRGNAARLLLERLTALGVY